MQIMEYSKLSDKQIMSLYNDVIDELDDRRIASYSKFNLNRNYSDVWSNGARSLPYGINTKDEALCVWNKIAEYFNPYSRLEEFSYEQVVSAKKTIKFGDTDKYGGIYYIHHVNEDTGYVGQSGNSLYRIRTHLINSNHTRSQHISKALHNKHEEFRFYILIKFSDLGINTSNSPFKYIIEDYYMYLLNTITPNGYNGGEYKPIV